MSNLSQSTADTPLNASAPSSRKPEKPAAGRILVVEDDEALRFLHTLALAREGYEVDAAADGEEGWVALQTVPYDLVLTDQKMPRLKGLELLCRMRRWGMRTPVIFVTGAPDIVQMHADGLLDIAAMIEKPSWISDVVKAVKCALPI